MAMRMPKKVMPLSELSAWLELFPFSSIYSGKKRKAMETEWARAHIALPLGAALNAFLFLTFFACIMFFLFSFLLFNDFLFSIGLALIFFSILLIFGFRLPSLASRHYARKIEADLPMALRAISLHLKVNLPFEKAIEHAANSNYASSPLWKECLLLIMSGKSVPSSLSQIASRVNSIQFSRAMHQLSIIYEEGIPPDSIDSLSDEITSQQLASTRLYASRVAVIGLFFISSSCLLPAFFLILNVAAAPLLGFGTTPLAVWLFYLLALPLLNLSILSIMLASSPSFLSFQKSKAVSKEAGELMLKSKMPRLGVLRLFFLSLILGFFSIISFSLLGFGDISFLLALIIASLPWAIRAYFEAKVHSQISSLESELPNILLAGSSSQRFSLESMLEHASSSPSPALSEQSCAVLRQIRAGSNPQKVLAQWAERTPSIMLSRALSLFLIGYQTGGKLQKALRASAEDLLSSFALVRERAALLSIQNYTLMAAAAFLVPAILSMSLSFSLQISQMQTGTPISLSNADISLAQSPAGASQSSDSGSLSLIHAAQGAIPVYLMLNCIIISFFISLAEGAREKMAHYAMLLTLLSQASWLIASGVIFA